MSGTIRIVVVEDHPVFRDGLVDILGDETDITVVAAVADGEAGVAAVRDQSPDVVVMDLNLPTVSGIEATAAITGGPDRPAVLILTMSEDDASLFAALRAGAHGYLLKESEADDIVRAVRSAARGEAVFGPRVADRVIGFFAGAARTASPEPFPDLTNREREILGLVAQGLDNRSIGRRLFLSEKTIRNRISDILAKLHVANRAEAVARARDAGLGSPD